MYTLTSAPIEVENDPGSTEGKKKLDIFLRFISMVFWQIGYVGWKQGVKYDWQIFGLGHCKDEVVIKWDGEGYG